MKKKKADSKSEVLKRRFKIKQNTEPEEIHPFEELKSKYAHLCASRYYDSDQFAVYEALFPATAHDFYTKSGADKYNHDALDLDIDKHVLDENKHIDEQLERHLGLIEELHVGVEIEKTSVEAKTVQVTKKLEELRADLDELKSLYRKVG